MLCSLVRRRSKKFSCNTSSLIKDLKTQHNTLFRGFTEASSRKQQQPASRGEKYPWAIHRQKILCSTLCFMTHRYYSLILLLKKSNALHFSLYFFFKVRHCVNKDNYLITPWIENWFELNVSWNPLSLSFKLAIWVLGYIPPHWKKSLS